MRSLRGFGGGAFAALLALALVVWSVAPGVDHARAVFETVRVHAEMIADHGHSHRFEEDLFAALHGHSHDAADHDHSEAMPTPGVGPAAAAVHGDVRRLPPPRGGPARLFRIERPPRA
jgi:hypothetical protein